MYMKTSIELIRSHQRMLKRGTTCISLFRKTNQFDKMKLGRYIQCWMIPSRRTSNLRSDSVMINMNEFLHKFFASQDHGILSIESACKKFCQLYKTMTDDEKKTFFKHLAKYYGPKQELIIQVSKQVCAAQERGDSVLLRTEERLRSALVPRFQTLFSEIGRIDDGVKYLVDMRADMLDLQHSMTSEVDVAYLRSLQYSLRDLLSLWFTVGFLNLQRVTWESPCDMVQKISEYEAVHPVRNWADLKRRVGLYRRCFVFTHSSMPREPMVVLHTALTNEISTSIHSIIGHRTFVSPAGTQTTTQSDVTTEDTTVEDPSKITTAMFYSITSTQKGLKGIDLGNYLIKKVVQELQYELPTIKQFSSISPIPGFREWLIGEINHQLHMKDISDKVTGNHSVLTEEEMSELEKFIDGGKQDPLETFKNLVCDHTWCNKEEYAAVLKVPLLRLCARYLYLEKRRGNALNPVANFHLQNGAVLWRVNWMADMTLRGLNNSCGIMVNYRYYLEDTVRNSQVYIEDKKITADQQVLTLLQE